MSRRAAPSGKQAKIPRGMAETLQDAWRSCARLPHRARRAARAGPPRTLLGTWRSATPMAAGGGTPVTRRRCRRRRRRRVPAPPRAFLAAQALQEPVRALGRCPGQREARAQLPQTLPEIWSSATPTAVDAGTPATRRRRRRRQRAPAPAPAPAACSGRRSRRAGSCARAPRRWPARPRRRARRPTRARRAPTPVILVASVDRVCCCLLADCRGEKSGMLGRTPTFVVARGCSVLGLLLHHETAALCERCCLVRLSHST